MKHKIHTLVSRLMVALLLVSLSQCKKGDDVSPNLIDPSDAKKVGAALIMPDGTQTKDGNPPAPSTSTQAPKVTPGATDKSTANGSTETLPVPYSNLNGGIGGVYIQIEGASTYFDIPVQGNAPASGTINLPVGIPENINSGSFSMAYCIYDRSGRVSNIIRIRFTIRRTEPLSPGKGTATIGEKSYNATAICDLNIPPYGKGYVIQMSSSQFIAFYNMRSGSNTLGNFETLLANSSTGVPSGPFALYFDDSGNLYSSVSGSATTNGKTVSASVTMKDLYTGRQVSLSAAGNCQ